MIPVFKPWLTPGNIFDTNKALFRKQISGTSSFVQKFETEFSRMHENINSTAVSNGSVALDIVLQSLELKKGDEVIMPSLTIISCLAAVTRTEAKPVFCDINESSWNMKLHNIKDVVTENTKAIIAVHTYGLPCEIAEISDFCKNEGILLIEDASEAHGVEVNSKFCGTFGDFSTFSFYANKHITAGEGGMILSKAKESHQKIQQMRNLDFKSEPRFKHDNFYWNSRLGGLQAALGYSQIKRKTFKKVIRKKQIQAKYYDELLDKYNYLFSLPVRELSGVKNNYWVYGLVLKHSDIRDDLLKRMLSDGIQCRPFFWPLHKQPAYLKNYESSGTFENAEKVGFNGFYLPLGSHITKKKQRLIIRRLVSNTEELINSE
jgi:perosamine synthetase